MPAQVGFSTTEVIAIVTTLMGALAATVVFLHRLLISAKDKEIERANNWVLTLTERLEMAADAKRKRDGKKPFERMEPVKPDHNSPATAAQEKSAVNETLKARIVAVVKDLGQDPIDDPEMPKVAVGDEIQITGTAKVTEAGHVKVKAEGSKQEP